MRIKHGFAFRGEYFSNEGPGDILVTPGNFAIGGGFQLGKVKYYCGPVPEGWVLQPGAVIVTMTDLSKAGDTLGFSAVVPDLPERLLHNQRIGLVEATCDRTSMSFIHWLMRTPSYRQEILATATGSTVRHTSPSRIEAFRFRLPPLETQRSICALLDALDDKIELNRRMNETLEAMAQAIFRDWFVDFGPTRAKMAGVPSYIAPDLWSLFPDRLDDEDKPEGWHPWKVADLATLRKGSVRPQSHPDELFEHYSIPAYDSGAEPKLERGAAIKSNKTPVPEHSVLLSKLNPEISRVWLPYATSGSPQVASTEFLAFCARTPASRALLYSVFRSERFRQALKGMVTGTSKSHQRVTPSSLLQAEAAIGVDATFSAFAALVGPLLDRMVANRAEARTLAQTRDLLLPKLLSGEIRAKEAERILETV